MSEPITGLNNAVLVWAREHSGQTIEEVAARLHRPPDEIQAWEEGIASPTYVQLETLAYQIYKRPLAVFFFPDPPDEPAPEQSFRTLPGSELAKLTADTRYKVRKARGFQLSLRELNDGVNPAERKLFRDLPIEPTAAAPDEAADQVRDYLGIDIEAQAGWGTTEVAQKTWRELLEGVGIYVFKDTFKQKEISGFCLIDDEFPVIYVNNSTPFSRQIFTMFHEVAHILVHSSGITQLDDRYIDAIDEQSRRIEIFSNGFAGEFLVPSSDFSSRIKTNPYSDQLSEGLADFYNVSREVILRKFLDLRRVTPDFYRQKVDEWATEAEMRKRGTGGGNYYNTQASYLGESFLRLAFGRYYQGRCTLEQLADHLNVKAKNVAGFERHALG